MNGSSLKSVPRLIVRYVAPGIEQEKRLFLLALANTFPIDTRTVERAECPSDASLCEGASSMVDLLVRVLMS